MANIAPILNDVMPEHQVWTPRESAVNAAVVQVDITPVVGIWARNWGAARSGQSTGIHRPLSATVVALAGVHETPHYLVTIDICTFGSNESFTEIHTAVVDALGVAKDAVLLHTMHTHSGPMIGETSRDLPGTEHLDSYRQTLITQIIAGAKEATEKLEPATITWTYGTCTIAANRDMPCGSRDVVAFNPDAEADDTLAVGRVSNARGEVVAILANYACHPTTLAYLNNLISPDYVGAAREIVQSELGVPMAFLQGASGELAPRDQYGPGVDTADRNGRSLGYAVLAAVNTMAAPSTHLEFEGTVESGAPLGIWVEKPASAAPGIISQRIDLPLEARRPLSAEELADKWSHIDPIAAEERQRRALRQAATLGEDGIAWTAAWIWQLGDAVIVAQSGEAFSYLQTELRRRHPERMIIVMNLVNGPCYGYLPTREAFDHDRYQVWQTLLAPGSLEELVESIDKAIDGLAPAREIVR